MPGGEAEAIIAALRADIDTAAHAILSAAERGLRNVASVGAGDRSAVVDLERTLLGILEACAFQDLAGQRLSRLTAVVAAAGAVEAPHDPLLYGPALPGTGLDQEAADALFSAAAGGL